MNNPTAPDPASKEAQKDKDLEDVIDEETARGTERKPRPAKRKAAAQLVREEIAYLVETRNVPRLVRVLRAEGYSEERIAAVRAFVTQQRGRSQGDR